MGNLASAVDELLAVDVAAEPDARLMQEAAEIRRQINRLEAAYLDRVVTVDRRGAATAEHGSTAAWLRTELRLAPTAAHRDVHLARDLADALPGTRAALADGDISLAHAQQLARLVGVLEPETLATVEPHLLDYARRATPLELHRAVAHVRHAYGPDKARRDEQDDFEARRLHATRGMHGNGLGSWQLHPVGHETVMTAIHALSRPHPGDDRTPAQRRADALIAMAEIALRCGELPVVGGVKPHATVIVALETLERRAGAPAATYGHGAVSGADWARRMLCDADVARIITGPASEILDAGRATHVHERLAGSAMR